MLSHAFTPTEEIYLNPNLLPLTAKGKHKLTGF